ncbi:hypothetical protein Clacol_007578 [Clathrus columnatus]|uniref:Uncharacterized protein n=1 Tax=Clathrus columnatus TaxID=1419009 RepID=A0AAV5ALK7_9AGAM|nr:hypothetical protein Clacol_007578 [Clathrus columnatus]
MATDRNDTGNRDPEWSHGSTTSISEITPLLRDDHKVEDRTPLPKLQVAALLLGLLPESLTSTLIYPFIVQLVKDLNIVQDEEAVGYYSGLIALWLVALFKARQVDKTKQTNKTGALNGNTGVVRAMLTENENKPSFKITDPSNRAQAFAFTPIMWATGGLLAKPGDRFPGFKNAFWKTYPYLLPCIAAGAVSFLAFLSTAIVLKEVHPPSFKTTFFIDPQRFQVDVFAVEVGEGTFSGKHSTVLIVERQNIQYNSESNFSCAYVALLAIFLATPIASGGLGLDISQIGLLIGGMGLFHGYTAFSAMYIFISCASPTKELLGTTNGIAQTVFSTMGIIGPSGITALFALSNEYNLWNGQLVYVVVCGLCGLGALSSHLLLPEKPGEEASKEIQYDIMEDNNVE